MNINFDCFLFFFENLIFGKEKVCKKGISDGIGKDLKGREREEESELERERSFQREREREREE